MDLVALKLAVEQVRQEYAFRFLYTLEGFGYVRREGSEFRLTPRVLNLGRVYLPTTPLWIIVEEALQKLTADVRETSSASVLDNIEIIRMVTVPGPRLITGHVTVGGRIRLTVLPPAASSSAGSRNKIWHEY